MKVTLERNHLLKSLSHVHRVVERRNTYPILANVLFKASDDRVELRATDLDIEVTESVPAMVSTPGTTTVPAPRARRSLLPRDRVWVSRWGVGVDCGYMGLPSIHPHPPIHSPTPTPPQVGPRMAGCAGALCWGAGLGVASIGACNLSGVL